MSSAPRKSTGAAQTGKPASKITDKAETPPETAEIEHDIERTRQQLSDTAQALAAKADVPARVKDKVHATTETAQAKADEVKHRAHAAAQQVTHQVQEGAQALAAKAEDVAGQAKTLTNQALEQLPPPVRERVEQVITTARQRPVPTAVVVVVALLLLRRLLRRAR
jgi:methyl-accepting chemotaxis protein